MALRCRKNQSSLTAAERSKYVAAVLSMKASGVHDQFVADHIGAMMDAHRGPAFLPWHREYLRRYELELQKIDPTVTLPYWDWSVDNSPSSSIWDASFMGGNGRPSDGRVMSGPFAYDAGSWTLTQGDPWDLPDLRRNFGVSASTLPTPGDVSAALAETDYDVAPYTRFSTSGFRNRLEGWISGPQLHNRVHVWVGGSMLPMSSPNDPVFFLHHCFIDKLWADWQQLHPGAGYVPTSGAAAGHNLGDSMQPWAGRGELITPASVLDHHALGYAYDTEGVCAPTFKFRDDLPTLKFFDDHPTLKFLDDGGTFKFRDDAPPTLKVFDDPQTLKFLDDGGTLKFRDDQPPTLKFSDDGGKLKVTDDPGTLKAVDDVKMPALDPPFDPGRFERVARPFLLSTPHHSMSWAQDQPRALESAIQAAEGELMQLEAVLTEAQQATSSRRLTEEETRQLEAVQQQYEALGAEHQQLLEAAASLGLRNR